MPISKQTIKNRLNQRSSPNDRIIKLGDLLDDLITKHNALLTKLDSNHAVASDHAATLTVTALDKRQ